MFSLLNATQGQYSIALAISLLFACISYVLVPKCRREAIAHQISSALPFLPRGRRTSTSKTPPRSVSPERIVPSNGPPPVDYKSILPPSQRETLNEVAQSYSSPEKERLLGGEISEAELKKNIIPFTADFRDYGPSTYTPTGFSMEEIKALGDFPDYSVLSGVPPPEPYKEFKIDTATARPFRPFRWAYHQTMCTYHPSLYVTQLQTPLTS